VPFRRPFIVLVVLAAAFALASPTAAAVRTFPGCGATLEACINTSPAGTTIRLRTNSLIAVPDTLDVAKGLSFEAAAGFKPKIGRSGTVATLSFMPGPGQTVSFRGIELRQVSVTAEATSGTGYRFVFENNKVRLNGGSSGASGVEAWFSGTSRASVLVRNNDISSSSSGIHVRVHGGPATVTGNRITAPVYGDSSQGISLNFGAAATTALVANNVVHDVSGCNCGSASGIYVAANQGATLTARILNNTVVDVGPEFANPGIYVLAFDPGTVNASIRNNTVTTAGFGISLNEQGGTIVATGDRNNTFANAQADAIGTSDFGTTFHAAPKFVNGGANDYRLAKGSPLVDRGATCIAGSPLPRSDLARRFRIAGRGVDIGAYERGSMRPGSVRGRSVTGSDAASTIAGSAGVDVLCGMGGADTLDGRGGPDFLYGGLGPDRLLGGDGADLLDARDGVGGNDRANGGPGFDVCRRDSGDRKTACP
jgi:hypothetical protein